MPDGDLASVFEGWLSYIVLLGSSRATRAYMHRCLTSNACVMSRSRTLNGDDDDDDRHDVLKGQSCNMKYELES